MIGGFLPSAQTLTNCLMALFTGFLVLLTYAQLQPNVVPVVVPLQGFSQGGKPEERMIFKNIGQQTAWSLTIGNAIAVLPYPLGKIHLTEIPPNTIPLDLYPSDGIGRPVGFDNPLSHQEFDAVHDGAHRLIYVWGTLKYRDFFYIPHYRNFCFAFGGPESLGVGLCSVQRPRQYYILESDEAGEPHAEPVPVPEMTGNTPR